MRNGKTFPQRAGLQTGTAPDWVRLLLAERNHVTEALRAWLGPRRSPDPEIEHGYWELLADGPPEELAEAVLERLDLEGERLLDLDGADLSRVRERLESEACNRLAGIELPEDEHERVRRNGLLLAEVAFEGQGALPTAAALYALCRDAGAEEGTFSVYQEALTCFKLGNVLFLVDERLEDRRRCVVLVQRSAERAEAAREAEGAPREALRALVLEMRIWLGHRQEGLGDLAAAAESFLYAIPCAGTLDDRVSCTARAASALATIGRSNEARELLLSVHGEVGQVEDEMVRELWEAVLWSVMEEIR
jgi:hypothetical protein